LVQKTDQRILKLLLVGESINFGLGQVLSTKVIPKYFSGMSNKLVIAEVISPQLGCASKPASLDKALAFLSLNDGDSEFGPFRVIIHSSCS